MPDKLSQFWKELKRRKVIHVIVVYASAAFVIIELVNNVYETLNLPEWTPAFTLIVLSIGFPLAIIFSWIYDITSKGITKTGKAVPVGQSTRLTNSIAVLPFQDMSPGKDQEYFCDGITEEIINALSHISNLKVIARTSAFAFKNQNLDMREIGEKLSVETLLEGSIQRDSNRVRITAQLIKTDDGSHLWSERFDRELKDIFAIQDEISMAIVDNLKIKLLGEECSVIQKRHTDNFEAYDLYLKAYHYLQQSTPQGSASAMEYLEQVLQRDPQFAYGYTLMAGIYQTGAFFGNVAPNIGYPRAKELAEKALEINSTCADAHHILGSVSMYYDWDWNEAGKHLTNALKLNPNSDSIHHSYSWYLVFMDRHSEAVVEAKRAVELDPLSAFFQAQLGEMYNYTCQFEKAIYQLKQTIAMHPGFYLGHWYLGVGYRGVSKMEEAIEEYKKAVELSGGVPMVIAFLANALYETGRTQEAGRLINNLEKRAEKEYIPAICFTTYYRLKGEHEKAYKYMEQAIREHDSYLPYNIVFPIKKSRIPNESRYAELMKQVGMKQYFQND